MTAELILGVLLVAACVLFLAGEAYGRSRERELGRRRVERVRWFYVGTPKEW